MRIMHMPVQGPEDVAGLLKSQPVGCKTIHHLVSKTGDRGLKTSGEREVKDETGHARGTAKQGLHVIRPETQRIAGKNGPL